MTSSLITEVLDSTTAGLQLRRHLMNVYHQEKYQSIPSQLELGMLTQLNIATTIAASKKIFKCFNTNGTIRSYPKLAKHQSLVACVHRIADPYVRVCAIYSLEQIRHIEAQAQGQTPSAKIKKIDWCVLEISKKVKADLLRTVHLEDGLVIASQKAVKDWQNFCKSRL